MSPKLSCNTRSTVVAPPNNEVLDGVGSSARYMTFDLLEAMTDSDEPIFAKYLLFFDGPLWRGIPGLTNADVSHM